MLDAYTHAVHRGRWIPKIMGDTRRQREAKVFRTFDPLKKLSAQMRANDVDCVRGEPIIPEFDGQWTPAGDALIVVGRALGRLPEFGGLKTMVSIGKKLKAGTPITIDELDKLDAELAHAENAYRWATRAQLKSVILTEQIAIELED